MKMKRNPNVTHRNILFSLIAFFSPLWAHAEEQHFEAEARMELQTSSQGEEVSWTGPQALELFKALNNRPDARRSICRGLESVLVDNTLCTMETGSTDAHCLLKLPRNGKEALRLPPCAGNGSEGPQPSVIGVGNIRPIEDVMNDSKNLPLLRLPLTDGDRDRLKPRLKDCN